MGRKKMVMNTIIVIVVFLSGVLITRHFMGESSVEVKQEQAVMNSEQSKESAVNSNGEAEVENIEEKQEVTIDHKPVLDTQYKKIYIYSYDTLESVVGETPTVTNLQDSRVWEKIGFSSDESSRIASSMYENKMTNLLAKIDANRSLSLKVIMIDNPQISKVEFGIANENEF